MSAVQYMRLGSSCIKLQAELKQFHVPSVYPYVHHPYACIHWPLETGVREPETWANKYTELEGGLNGGTCTCPNVRN